MSFTNYLGDTPRAKLLDFLGDHPASDYSITELADKANISRPTIYVILPELQRLGLVVRTRTLGRSQLFALNTEHPVVQAVLVADLGETRGSGRASGKKAKPIPA